jgi:PhnB protein
MQLNAYLQFNGQCEEAFKFYEQALGGKIIAMTRYDSTPAMGHVPAEMRDKVVHARVQIGDTILMGSDVPSDRYPGAPRGFALSARFPNVAESERAFETLANGGQISMPMGQTFFAPSFGMVTDRFGVPWMILCEQR